MKIGFVSNGNPEDKRNWSGTTWNMYSSLLTCHSVEWVRVAEEPLVSILSKSKAWYVRNLLRKNFNRYYSVSVAKNFSKQVDSWLRHHNKYDVLVVPGNSQCIAYMETEVPIVQVTDANFGAMIDYYPSFSNLLTTNIRTGDEIERRSFNKATELVFSSQWAMSTAMARYNVGRFKCTVIPFGANLDNDQYDDRRILHDKRHAIKRELQILFLGVDWERKGGTLAIETLQCLNSRGIPAELHVVGVEPPGYFHPVENVKIHGFLNKNSIAEEEKLRNIIMASDMLLLPTKAECSAIAFAEASAYGLPIITHDTGGIGDYVQNNYNGYRLPLGATSSDFADVIERLYNSREDHHKLQENAIKFYKEKLNWNSWLNDFNNVLNRVTR